MLDHFTIFTKTGLVLYSRSFTPQIPPSTTGSSSHPIDSLVVQAFLQDDVASSTFQKESYTLRYAFANDVECVFVAVHQRILQLGYVDQLLETIKQDFLSRFRPFLVALSKQSQPQSSSSLTLQQDGSGAGLGSDSVKKLQRSYWSAYPAWDQHFAQTLRTMERSAAQSKRKGPAGSANMARIASSSSSNSIPAATGVEAASVEASGGEETPRGLNGDAGSNKDVAKNVEALRNRLKKAEISAGGKKGKKGGASKESPAGSGTESAPGTPTGKKSKGPAKEMRRWDGAKVTDKDMAALDFSGGAGGVAAAALGERGEEKGSLSGWIDEKSLGKRKDGMYDLADVDDAQGYKEEDDDDEDDDDDDQNEETVSSSKGGFLSRFASLGTSSQANGSAGGGFFSRLTGNRPLTAQDLAPALSAMQSHLQSKNVAADVASKLCQSVSSSLVGKQLGNFSSIKSEVRRALEDSITRILTPKTSTDILLEISSKKQRSALARQHQQQQAQQQGSVDPYSLCFVGVNGVGKSTNLAKVCFWLLQNNLRVLIAACDTFRSGAVEQLRVHVRNLGQLEVDGQRVGDGIDEGDGRGVQNKIELYERGYGKDAAGIAKDALSYASSHGFDVVLIDTAGRMQDNEPLMRALAKLVAVNDPDKIIFVGEALVGNEAVDQLTKFDRSLKDFSGVSRPRGLDGMLLTKFDTSEYIFSQFSPFSRLNLADNAGALCN